MGGEPIRFLHVEAAGMDSYRGPIPWFPHRLLSVGNSMEEENSFRWLVLRQWEAPTLSVWQTACQVGGLQQGIQDELDETC